MSASPLRTTLKAWPAVAFATIGLCFLTKAVAGWLGVDLPDQQNVAVVKRCLESAFASSRHFVAAALLVAQVVALLPAVEELLFRGLLFRLPTRLFARHFPCSISRSRPAQDPPQAAQSGGIGDAALPMYSGRDASPMRPQEIRRHPHSIIRLFDYSIIFFSSLLFSAAHYIAQPWPDAAFLALFFFGAAQCALYRKTGRIWCAMLNHALFNLTNLVLLFVLPEA